MTMTETPSQAPAPRPPARRKRRARRAPASPKPKAYLDGLSVKDCAKGCGASGCVISGATYCAHPMKGGLQGRDMHDAAALQRLEAAKKRLRQSK